jgi:hypothetical protein
MTMTAPAVEPVNATAEQAVQLAEDYAAGKLDADAYFAAMDALAQVAIKQELEHAV